MRAIKISCPACKYHTEVANISLDQIFHLASVFYFFLIVICNTLLIDAKYHCFTEEKRLGIALHSTPFRAFGDRHLVIL